MFFRIISLLIPLIALLIGALISAANGISVVTYAPNGIAILIGVPLSLFISRLPLKNNRPLLYGVTTASLFCLLATFLNEGPYGVHRWIRLGPFQLNASIIFSPIFIFALSRFNSNLGLVLIYGVSAIHYLQPDAGQFTAFFLAVLAFSVITIRDFTVQIKLLLLLPIALVLVWRKDDPLLAVENVERVLRIAGEIGFIGYTFVFATAVLILLPFYRSASQTRYDRNFEFSVSGSLLAYWLGTFIITEFGNFPVPIIGAGASPVLGWYISMGLIYSLRTAASSTQTETPSAGF